MAAYLARDGFTGAAEILEGPQGMGVGMSTDANPSRLVEGLGTRWATAGDLVQVSRLVPPHPSGGRRLAAGDAGACSLRLSDLAQVVTHVHQGAIDVLGPVVTAGHRAPEQVLDGYGAGIWWRNYGHAGLTEFDAHFLDASTQALRDRVSAWCWTPRWTAPTRERWIGKVTVHTTGWPRADRARG
jgi:2-methylcitrate dehydratase PrpD